MLYKNTILFLMIFTVPFFSTAQNAVAFKIKNAGLTVNGNFAEYTVDIAYDKATPENSKFDGTVTIKSINTGIKMRDEHLVKEDYFNAGKFPNMTFKSTGVKSADGNTLNVSGDITIKGKTKKISFPVKITTSGTKTRFTGEFKLNRRDFGVGGSSILMSDNLVVLLDITK